MITESLKITWKIVRKATKIKGRGHTLNTYCSYVAENNNHKHRLKTREGTKLFEILNNTIISDDDRYCNMVLIDGFYYKNKLILLKNPRLINW
jgi:hypothetical protein